TGAASPKTSAPVGPSRPSTSPRMCWKRCAGFWAGHTLRGSSFNITKIILRILIIKLGSIGDVVHTLPALAALRRAMAASHLARAVERGGAAQLLQGHPC